MSFLPQLEAQDELFLIRTRVHSVYLRKLDLTATRPENISPAFLRALAAQASFQEPKKEPVALLPVSVSSLPPKCSQKSDCSRDLTLNSKFALCLNPLYIKANPKIFRLSKYAEQFRPNRPLALVSKDFVAKQIPFNSSGATSSGYGGGEYSVTPGIFWL